MTLPSSGELSMSAINTEFGRGYELASYRGVQWWTDANATGYFGNPQIEMVEFYGKRATAPIQNGYVDAAHIGGAGPSWLATGKYIGVPHANRIVVVATMTGDTTGSPITGVNIGGVAGTLAARSSGSGSMRACAVYYRHMPGAETNVDIRVTNSNNASQCFMVIYAIYSSNHAHIDGSSGIGTNTAANANNLTSQAGGVCIAATHHRNTNGTTLGGTMGGTWATNWNADVGGGCNGAVGWKWTDGSAGSAQASWAGAVNGSIAAACFGPM